MACKSKIKKYRFGGSMSELPNRKFGGFIPGILQVAGGAALSIIPGGAVAGVPLMASGVGSMVSEAQTQKADKLSVESMESAKRMNEANNFVDNIDPRMLNRQLGGSIGVGNQGKLDLNTQVSKLTGGNGTPDSIKLGDIAMVDSGEVKFGDYIFSNELKYNG